ncbi:MAG TPA: DUF3400 domain-containing protein, partial [Plasticicumulans sp.]|nr:DUF3400 domain-containing protein [Plasticicumulans sp.]
GDVAPFLGRSQEARLAAFATARGPQVLADVALVIRKKVDAKLLPEDAGIGVLADGRNGPLGGEAFFAFFEDRFLALSAGESLKLLAQAFQLVLLIVVELASRRLGADWQQGFIERARSGGIERVLL